MDWCEKNPGIDYVFGFAFYDMLDALKRGEAAEYGGRHRTRAFGQREAARLQGVFRLRRQELKKRSAARGAHRGDRPRVSTSAMS